jgi:hypothetical protein
MAQRHPKTAPGKGKAKAQRHLIQYSNYTQLATNKNGPRSLWQDTEDGNLPPWRKMFSIDYKDKTEGGELHTLFQLPLRIISMSNT